MDWMNELNEWLKINRNLYKIIYSKKKVAIIKLIFSYNV